MRAVVYARVSSSAQRDRHTIESQLRVVPAFISERGWELVAPPTTYVDDGRTAKAGHLEARQAFTRLLGDAAAGRFDVVCVVDFDRLTRSEDLAERGQVLGAFQRAGVQIAVSSTGQVLDLSSSLGDLYSSLQAVFAAEENRKRRERSVRGRMQAIARGQKPAGPPPYGLAWDPVAKAWSIHEDEAAVVRELYERVAAGESCREVGVDFERRGIRSPRGGRWAYAAWNLLRRTTYRGQYQADAQRGAVVAVPRIVDDVLWYAAQDALRRTKAKGLVHRRHVYLCAEIGVCGLCGAPMWAFPGWRSGQKRRSYYVCSRRRHPRHGEQACPARFWGVEEVDARVWKTVAEFLQRPDLLELVRQALGATGDDARTAASDLADYQGRLERLEKVEAAILQRFRRGLISEAAMDAEVKATARERALLVRQVEACRARQEAARQEGAGVAEVMEIAAELREQLALSDPEDRRTIVRAVVPGTGEAVVTMGPDEVVVGLRLAARSADGGAVRAVELRVVG